MENQVTMEQIVKRFDSFGEYLEPKLDRDIEEHRKGQFVLCFRNEAGELLQDVSVKIRQVSHEFRFGCSLFHLEQFPDEERNAVYKAKFKELFNYAVVPFYWDTLEPQEGKPRFEKDSAVISRRPPIDTIMDFCDENNIRTKGHCLVYNSFQPDWLPEHNRDIKIKLDRRLRAIADRYGDRFPDFDVINEMLTIYKNCYKGNKVRNLQITDERDHESWSFDVCRRYFPHSRLFWNEGINESFGEHYRGYRSFYYMTLEKMLTAGVPIQGIGMQYHAYRLREDFCNPLRLLDVFDCYGEFGLPIHVSEVSIPSFSNDPSDEMWQAELTKRLFKLWFGRKHCDAIVWWNLADKTAYGTENQYHAGLLREDCSEKPAYRVLKHLIGEEWNTSLERTVSEPFRFSGFYGAYDLEILHKGKKTTRRIDLFRDNTGYDNRLCDFRAKDIILS